MDYWLNNIKMKNKTLILVIALLFNVFTFAQKQITEGIIITKQVLSSDNAMISNQLSQLGDINSITYIKDSRSRVEITNPMSGDITVISNTDEMKALTLISNPILGKKILNSIFRCF